MAKKNVCDPLKPCKKCTWLILIVAILYAVQDYGVSMPWFLIKPFTAALLLIGIHSLHMLK